MMPDPTTAITNNAVPRNSASQRRVFMAGETNARPWRARPMSVTPDGEHLLNERGAHISTTLAPNDAA
jgi:hypothetical protein